MGFSLPKTQQNFAGGSGNNPADFDEDVRNLDLSNTPWLSKNTSNEKKFPKPNSNWSE